MQTTVTYMSDNFARILHAGQRVGTLFRTDSGTSYVLMNDSTHERVFTDDAAVYAFLQTWSPRAL